MNERTSLSNLYLKGIVHKSNSSQVESSNILCSERSKWSYFINIVKIVFNWFKWSHYDWNPTRWIVSDQWNFAIGHSSTPTSTGSTIFNTASNEKNILRIDSTVWNHVDSCRKFVDDENGAFNFESTEWNNSFDNEHFNEQPPWNV